MAHLKLCSICNKCFKSLKKGGTICPDCWTVRNKVIKQERKDAIATTKPETDERKAKLERIRKALAEAKERGELPFIRF